MGNGFGYVQKEIHFQPISLSDERWGEVGRRTIWRLCSVYEGRIQSRCSTGFGHFMAATLYIVGRTRQTIQTIGWQSKDGHLSGCQNITTKNQTIWQFFRNSANGFPYNYPYWIHAAMKPIFGIKTIVFFLVLEIVCIFAWQIETYKKNILPWVQ